MIDNAIWRICAPLGMVLIDIPSGEMPLEVYTVLFTYSANQANQLK